MKGKIVIDRELCKGCGYCIIACPREVIVLEKGFNAMACHPAVPGNTDRCSGCGLCAIVCPDIAIEVWREEKKGQKAEGRRQKYGKKK
jgi:2-oxoglutarate ferredoxin oxidoreductase subunit delta